MTRIRHDLRILYVVPGNIDDRVSMIFARRQIASVAKLGVSTKTFFLESRTNPLAVLKELYRLRRIVKQFNPHLLHCQFGTMTSWIGVLACPLRLVVTFRGSDLNPTPSMQKIRSCTGHLLSHISSVIALKNICVSEELKARLLPPARRKSLVLANGVPLEEFAPLSKESARARLGWSRDTYIVLFNAGKSPEVKRLDLAQEVVEIVAGRLPGLQLQVMNGTVGAEDVRSMLYGADALLVTSDFEGSPNIVKEAIVTGTPIVSVRVGDVAEQCKGLTACEIVDRSPKALAIALEKVLTEGGRSNGRSIAADRLDDRRIASKLVGVYLTCIPEAGIPEMNLQPTKD